MSDIFQEFDFKKIKSALKSNDFKIFLEKKVKEMLTEITDQNLNTKEHLNYKGIYRNNHKVVVDVNRKTITISNTTDIPVDSLNVSVASNYPNGFDLAKAVEYGTGVVGANSAASAYAGEDGWAYDINNHGDKGWTYIVNGTMVWTNGVTGTLIFEKTKQKIEQEFDSWVMEYIEKLSF